MENIFLEFSWKYIATGKNNPSPIPILLATSYPLSFSIFIPDTNVPAVSIISSTIIAVNKKIEEVKADIEKYDRKIASLDDEFEKEKVARNMFQMVRENEVIYKYVEKNNNKTENTKEEKWKEN